MITPLATFRRTLVCSVALIGSACLAATEDQTLPLAAGWNLIAFQVVPTNPSPDKVFGTLGTSFGSAWAYDNTAKLWTVYEPPSVAKPQADQVARMAPVEPGRAYWVYANRAVPEWKITGTPPAQVPALNFQNGWNLVGIPTGTAQLPEPVNMPSVLAAAGLDYDLLLRWEAGFYRRYTTDDTQVSDAQMLEFDPNKGYWVRLTSAGATLKPTLLCTVRTDLDAEPYGNYPSFEDLRIGDSPLPLKADEQTIIRFFPGEDTQYLRLANTGGGILLWELVWEPLDAPAAGWLDLSAAHGVTTIETDVISLFLNRKDLSRGTYRGRLTLRTTAGDRVFSVVAEVPELGGEWKGLATISSVGTGQAQRANAVPSVDLQISFFEDRTVPGLLRGGIESHNVTLWPLDVALVGHVVTSDGNSFTLGGGYVLPPGDQNEPPYASFGTNQDPLDVDWLEDHILDVLNPLPLPLYRAVTLEGRLTSADPQSGYVIAGAYHETVYGLLRAPIRVEGHFELRRVNARPFASTQTAIGTDSGVGTAFVVHQGTNNPTGTLGATFEQRVAVITDLVLQDLQVEVDFQGVTASALHVELVAPNGDTAVLHDRQNLSAAALAGANFPLSRIPATSLTTAFVARGTPTRGTWTLRGQYSGATGYLKSWAVKLIGQPVFDLDGVVRDAAGSGVPADLQIAGLPYASLFQSSADGSFHLHRVPGIPLNLFAAVPGRTDGAAYGGLETSFLLPQFPPGNDRKQQLAARFQPLPVMPVPAAATPGYGGYGTTSNPVTVVLPPATIGPAEPRLTAFPTAGPAPLTARLWLEASFAPGSTVHWDFGDGTAAEGADLRTVEHLFPTVKTGGYPVTASFPGGTATVLVCALPTIDQTPYDVNFFALSFTGAGCVPTNIATRLSTGQPLVMVQQADCASFDIDRAPLTSPTNRRFSQDGFPPAGYVLAPEDLDAIFQGEDSTYQNDLDPYANSIEPDVFHPYPRNGAVGDGRLPRYRMFCNLGTPIVAPQLSEVYTVPAPPIPTPVVDPLLAPEADRTARARDLRLVVGPLSAPWSP
jgi:subtilisin-like proprotein convertase family protein